VSLRSQLLPAASIVLAMCSIQYGAALAKGLFPVLGPLGATTLRLLLAALLLALVFRPWRGGLPAGGRRAIAGYGIALGLMNLCYYLALARAPMGIVVAVEFTGPLAVAIAASRRPVDFLWVLLAVAGLLLLVPWRSGTASVDGAGLGLALLSGFFWALYIVFGTRAGAVHGGRGVALGMIVAALVALPFGGDLLRDAVLDWKILGLGLAVATLSSALPYVLEMHAMQQMPTRTFGIFMSVEPAIAALSGFLFLGERLAALQFIAIACVVLASLGSAATSRRPAA
jgi:inner membrane transporter RhtA